jgi:hypothetical protein
MFAKTFLRRHPLWRDALLWALPALVAGAAFRCLLMSYLPYANWNADSRSYYSFAHNLMAHGYVSLYDKRRYLYPIFLLPVTWLPGSPLRWLAPIQHAAGLLTLVPLAYVIRRVLACWKLWIVPLTVLYAVLPITLWFEREVLAEALFFDFMIWAMAGWIAWVEEARPERRARLFWWFFAALALFMLTRPAGRFFWPGLFIGVIAIGAWRDRKVVLSLGSLFLLTLTMGSRTQGAWLLYLSCFPLTRLDTPLLADYKAEIRDKVEDSRAHLDSYYGDNGWAFEFLRDPANDPGRPLWARLERESERKVSVYRSLAREAILSHPVLYLGLGLDRLIASANPSNFNPSHFHADTYARRFEHFYDESREGEKTPLRELFALPKQGPLPSYAEFATRLGGPAESRASRTMTAWGRLVCGSWADLVVLPSSRGLAVPPKLTLRFTILGWCVAAGAMLSLLPLYRRTLGVWMLASFGYLGSVFLLTIANSRYFDLVWPVLFLLAVLPGDRALARWPAWRRRRLIGMRGAEADTKDRPALVGSL